MMKEDWTFRDAESPEKSAHYWEHEREKSNLAGSKQVDTNSMRFLVESVICRQRTFRSVNRRIGAYSSISE